MVTLDESVGTPPLTHDEASPKFKGVALMFVTETNAAPGCAKTEPARNKADTRRKVKRFACDGKVELCSIFDK
jgi:hypothetical protein